MPQSPRGDDGFLRPDEADMPRWPEEVRQAQVTLPEDYLGRTLTVTTYFHADDIRPRPIYPSIGSTDALTAWTVVVSVKYDAIMTVYAILALVMAGVYLLDCLGGVRGSGTPLLCLHYMLLFLDEAYITYAGYYSVISSNVLGQCLSGLYMVPLYLYLALRLKSRWRWPLCAAILVWAVYDGVRRYIVLRQGLALSIGPEGLVLLLILAVAYCLETRQQLRRSRVEKKRLSMYGLVALAVTAVYLVSRARAWGSLGDYLFYGVWVALSMGNFESVLTPVTDIISYVTVILVITGAVRRSVRSRETMSILAERSRLTLEGYERVLRTEEQTNAARHEMRHHVAVLSGLLQEGDTPRAQDYLASLAEDMDKLPPVRYSANILVNVIAGTYLDRAKAEGIRVEHALRVPPELAIPDGDLSVFLSNMLENALQACRRLGPDRDRYIRVQMHLHEDALFIGCVNSAGDEQDEGEDTDMDGVRRHGYGLDVMRRIAEKYDSILVIDRGPGEFSVKSNLSLKGAG